MRPLHPTNRLSIRGGNTKGDGWSKFENFGRHPEILVEKWLKKY